MKAKPKEGRMLKAERTICARSLHRKCVLSMFGGEMGMVSVEEEIRRVKEGGPGCQINCIRPHSFLYPLALNRPGKPLEAGTEDYYESRYFHFNNVTDTAV